jgi:hypothetical protein
MPKVESPDKIWTVFGFADDGLPDDVEDGSEELYRIPPRVLAFRLHVGVLDGDVKRQVVASIRAQVAKMTDVELHRITAYSAPLDFTTSGQQRWIGRDHTETLYPDQY